MWDSQKLFEVYHGKLPFLGAFASAAYHLDEYSEYPTTGYNNAAKSRSESSYSTLSGFSEIGTFDWLAPNDLSITLRETWNLAFPYVGLSNNGTYTNLNSALLVGRTSDAVFIAFRGTNDFDGTFGRLEKSMVITGGGPTRDVDDWFKAFPLDGGMGTHFERFSEAILAITSYVNNPINGIDKVYVTGHSLGAAMAELLARTHLFDGRIELETVSFASPGVQNVNRLQSSKSLNVLIEGDPITDTKKLDTWWGKLLNANYGQAGDRFIISPVVRIGVPVEELHDVDLYEAATSVLMALPMIEALQANESIDEYYVRAEVHYNDAATTGQNPWTVSLPSGVVRGTKYNDIIVGRANDSRHNIAGGAGSDIIIGGSLADSINGGAAADIMSGGGGNDVYRVDDAGDVVTEAGNEGVDKVNTTISYRLGDNLEHLTLLGSSKINGEGNELANTIIGNTATNVIRGHAGDDTLRGHGGADYLYGDDGRDRLHGGEDQDTIYGGDDNDTLLGDADADILIGGDNDDLLRGGSENDSLFGNTGEDRLYGEGGGGYARWRYGQRRSNGRFRCRSICFQERPRRRQNYRLCAGHRQNRSPQHNRRNKLFVYRIPYWQRWFCRH